jgi:hypothetical protein
MTSTPPVRRRAALLLSVAFLTAAFAAPVPPAAAATVPGSIWGSTVPGNAASEDPGPVEVGVKFRTDVEVRVTGIRFWRGPGNDGPHIGHLWRGDGTLLAGVAFPAPVGDGWQEARFDLPVSIAPGTTYVASYFAPGGRYAYDLGYFAAGPYTNGPLRALADGEDGGNGVFVYADGPAFPTETFGSLNYWVDVLVEPSSRTEKRAVRDAVAGLRPTVPARPDGLLLDAALTALEASLADRLWRDGDHLDPAAGRAVFTREARAAAHLQILSVLSRGRTLGAELRAVIARLVAVDRGLAARAVAEAPGLGVPEARIAKARGLIRLGDALARRRLAPAAITVYGQAWSLVRPPSP